MRILTVFFILNAMFLLLHEIESAYEKEWEILKLPGKITGFLLLHIPLILLFFYGVIEIERRTLAGTVIGVIAGIGGILPFLIHKVIVRRKDHFILPISNILIFTNIGTGILTVMCVLFLNQP